MIQPSEPTHRYQPVNSHEEEVLLECNSCGDVSVLDDGSGPCCRKCNVHAIRDRIPGNDLKSTFSKPALFSEGSS